MSGIFGIFNRDGAAVEDQQLKRMAEVLAHRGPDGIHWQPHAAVGLGHLMLWTTPESLHETLPLANAGGHFILTADARVDNRSELIAAFGWKQRPAANINDSQLILAAYEKWGQACPEHLIGDFAFALWDARQQRLFCAVDPIAIRPLFYFYTPNRFAFGSEIKALHTMADAPRAINEASIAYHLTRVPCHEPGETSYQGIYRLLPGHSITITTTRLHKKIYWQLDPERTIHLESDQAYADAFREIFSEAVRCRLRSAYPLGVQLSGGLDSCSVAAMTRKFLPVSTALPLFSAYFSGSKDTDERPYVDDLVAQGNYDLHRVNGSQIDLMENLEAFVASQDEPLFNAFVWVDRQLQQQAKVQGVRIMLDGIDGDATVAPPDLRDSYLPELFRAGHFWRFWQEIDGHSRLFGATRWRAAYRFGLKPLLPCLIHPRTLQPRTLSGLLTDIISPAFAHRMQIMQHLQAQGGYFWRPRKSARQSHFAQVTQRYVGRADMIHQAATKFGIEYRHPFADRRLQEFCLAVPEKQKLYCGWGRIIMRRALADLLPESVLQRPGKARLDLGYLRPLLNFLAPQIRDQSRNLESYVDASTVQNVFRRYLVFNDTSEVHNAERVATLALWLGNVSADLK